MKFGVCGNLSRLPAIIEAGYDYVEMNFSTLALMPEEEFIKTRDELARQNFHAEAFNGFFKSDVVLYGEKADLNAIAAYCETGFSRAAQLGGQVAVLGSGGARAIPEGMTKEEAEEQFCRVLTVCGDVAQKYGMRIAIEPLRAFETNFIHTVADAAEIIGLSPDSVALGITPDIYHMLEGGEAFDELRRFSDKLFHAHICAPDRHYPSPERPAEDNILYRDFFRALNAAKYQGTISIEGIATDMVTDLPSALAILYAAQDQI